MAEVTVSVNGRAYKMVCDDGQEPHLLSLADYINSRIEDLKKDVGQVGDARLLLMISIMIADELLELRSHKGRSAKVSGDSQEGDSQESSGGLQFKISHAEVDLLQVATSRVEALVEKLNKDLPPEEEGGRELPDTASR